MEAARLKWLIVMFTALSSLSANAQSTGESADELLNDANTVLRQIDTNQFAEVWTNAAPFVKARIMQEQFVTDMRQARQMLGPVRNRAWASVTRLRYNNVPGVPDGLYANVDVATTLASGSDFHEKLSFHFDDDGHWHLTGYVPQQTESIHSAIGRLPEPGKDLSRQGCGGGDARAPGPVRVLHAAPDPKRLNTVPPRHQAHLALQDRRGRATHPHRTGHPNRVGPVASAVRHAIIQSRSRSRASTSVSHRPKHRA